MSSHRIAALILCVPLLSGAHWTERNDTDVSEGQNAFGEGDFAVAVARFRDALDGEGEQARLHFDLGTAQIRLSLLKATQQEREQELDLGIISLRSANAPRGSALREMVDYNLASALVLRGRFADALVLYRRLLIQNPDHDNARHNLELALLAMRGLAGGDKRLSDRLQGIVEPKHGATEPSAAGQNPTGLGHGPGQAQGNQDAGVLGAADGGLVAKVDTQGEADPDNSSGENASGSSQGDANEAEGTSEEAADASAGASLPRSTSIVNLKEKLEALERRSAELRRASILRETTSRVRNPDKRAKDQ